MSIVPTVDVHLFAAARAAAGAPVLQVEAGTLGDVLDRLVALAPALAAVLPRCSYLLDEVALKRAEVGTAVPAGSRLDVLPPFAGG